MLSTASCRHYAAAQEAAGKCVMAGALQNPVDAGVFVFKDCDEAWVLHSLPFLSLTPA